jgi:hypothetical protein
VNHDPKPENFIVWDIKTNSAVKNWDIIKDIKWSKLNFPNHLNALHQMYQNSPGWEDEITKETK